MLLARIDVAIMTYETLNNNWSSYIKDKDGCCSPKTSLRFVYLGYNSAVFSFSAKKDILEFGENLKIYLGKRAARTDVSVADYRVAVAQL